VFTGIVEELGEVVGLEDLGDSVRLRVRGPVVLSDASLGDSIAVNGCCLTIVEHDSAQFSADVMHESLDKTSLGDLTPGDLVNLERAMRADSRLGGHLVQGHVDGTGRVLERTPSEHWDLVRIGVPSDLVRYLAPKGSVTVDGTSLTVVDVVDDDPGSAHPYFTVALIPTTLAASTLGHRQIGDRVNLEVDVIAKYVERLLSARGGG
jgi:riboflavin synthase